MEYIYRLAIRIIDTFNAYCARRNIRRCAAAAAQGRSITAMPCESAIVVYDDQDTPPADITRLYNELARQGALSSARLAKFIGAAGRPSLVRVVARFANRTLLVANLASGEATIDLEAGHAETLPKVPGAVYF